MSIPAGDASRGRILDRRLKLSDRLRTFTHGGRDYALTSAVPLTYLAASPGLLALLRRFSSPRRLADLVEAPPGPAVESFVATLHRVGVLVDADSPDPVHSFRGGGGGSGSGNATRTLCLYPARSCNLRCVYCYAASGQSAGSRMSPEDAAVAIDDFFATLGDGVRGAILKFHGGGEPTTNFPVMEAAWARFRELARRRGVAPRVCAITNGTFGPEVLRTLLEPEWRLEVSYDGPRQGIQRPAASNGESRDRVVANLLALRRAGKVLRTRATLTRDGLASMRDLVDDAAEIGIHQVQVEPASVVNRSADPLDGPPAPAEFAEAFLDGLGHALRHGVELATAAWSHTRVGDGRYCGALSGSRALTPDGFVSACTETCDGTDPDDPFIVGRLDLAGRRFEILPERERSLRSRVGYDLPGCRDCFLVDTCAGGCAKRAHAQTGDALVRDEDFCARSLVVNPSIVADLADGRLLPDAGWQPVEARLDPSESSLPGVWGRLVALVPPFARSRWNADPSRRPFLPVDGKAPRFFHLPASEK